MSVSRRLGKHTHHGEDRYARRRGTLRHPSSVRSSLSAAARRDHDIGLASGWDVRGAVGSVLALCVWPLALVPLRVEFVPTLPDAPLPVLVIVEPIEYLEIQRRLREKTVHDLSRVR